MHLLIKNTTILSPNSPHNGHKHDILIQDGEIKSIAKPGTLSADKAEIIDGEATFLSVGWMDMRAHFADPGEEFKEDIESGCNAAAAGGFTGVALLPGTHPPVHSKSEVEYIITKGRNHLTSVYPIGCITQNREGKELAEMYDMQASGAVAFTDGNRPIKDSGLMHRALLYTKGFDGLILSHAEDKGLTALGQMNEGVTSAKLGMKGIPGLAEELIVKRDIELARYNDARVHFSHISTANSVELIRQAKGEGLKVTADVAIHNLIWEDSALEDYDSNYKVNPPLRLQSDIKALLQGLKDGTIDAICTDHNPQDIENKKLEFDYAAFGMIGLQTFLPLLIKIEPVLGWDVIIKAITTNPRNILGLSVGEIKEGAKANLTLFSTHSKWEFNKKTNRSKSVNSPLFNTELTGKVLVTVNNNKALQF